MLSYKKIWAFKQQITEPTKFQTLCSLFNPKETVDDLKNIAVYTVPFYLLYLTGLTDVYAAVSTGLGTNYGNKITLTSAIDTSFAELEDEQLLNQNQQDKMSEIVNLQNQEKIKLEGYGLRTVIGFGIMEYLQNQNISSGTEILYNLGVDGLLLISSFLVSAFFNIPNSHKFYTENIKPIKQAKNKDHDNLENMAWDDDRKTIILEKHEFTKIIE